MMFPSPRVIVIDDEPAHLDGLVRGLNRRGVASLPILFTGETTQFPACPDVRVIFADLHLGPGGFSSDHTTDFSTINSLLENNVKPAGPYFILLWTQYPDQAPALRTFLDQRLEGVKKPFDVVPLDKADHLDGNGDVRNEEKLVAAINSVAGGLPQIGALFDWEGRVLKATGDTVSSLLELTSAEEADQRPDRVRTILAKLAIEAAGEKHVDHDRFRAVNEALLPILADRIAALRSAHGSNAIWARAFDTGDDARGLSADEAAKLNRLVHVADPGNAARSAASSSRCLNESISGVYSISKNATPPKISSGAKISSRTTVGSAGCGCSAKPPVIMRSRSRVRCPFISVWISRKRTGAGNSRRPPCGRVPRSSSVEPFDCCASAPAFRFHCLPPRFGTSIRSIGCASSFSTTSSITFMPTAADRA